jgi:hypothetical protein
MSQVTAKASATGKIITMNTSIDTCLVFDFVTKIDLASIIEGHDLSRFKQYWESKLSEEVHEGGVLYLEAFRSRKTSFGGVSFVHFKSSYIQEVLKCEDKGRELVDKTHALPIEEQRRIVSESLPNTRRELNRVLRASNVKFGENYLLQLEQSDDAASFVHQIAKERRDMEGVYKKTNTPLNLLILFWGNGLILLPHNFRIWANAGKWKGLAETNPKILDSVKKIYTTQHLAGYSDARMSLILNYFATTSTIEIADLSLDLIIKYEKLTEKLLIDQYLAEKYLSPHNSTNKNTPAQHALSRLHKAILSLTAGFNSENPGSAVKLSTRRIFKPEAEARRDIHFKWIAEKYPELSNWGNYLHLYLSTSRSARLGQPISSLNKFIDFLGALPNPPHEPWLVKRQIHITDPSLINQHTFYQYLLNNSTPNSRTLKATLTTVRKFFLWLRDYLISIGKLEESTFQDPVLETDKIGQTRTISRTQRDSLPPFLISEMKLALIENDFAVAKLFSRSTVQVTDQETGYKVGVFYPGTAICMYTLLDSPIRSHQARWLDSGSLDYKVYNQQTRQMEYNQSPYAIYGREEGVLQLHVDALRAESWLSMWINTNKTSNSESGSDGYSIPYVSPKVEELIQLQQSWSRRYLPELKAPLNYREYMQDVREYRPNVTEGPEVSPLFRDPTRPEQKGPITYSRLVRFYTYLLSVVEERIFDKHGHRLRLVTTDENGKRTWAVDLHSLRVSGITNLIEAGVPIEVVQQYVVGHKVLVMTLHYLKYSPAKLKGFIEQAYERMANDQDFVGSQSFIDAINEFTPFLLSQEGKGTGPAFEALNAGDGIIVVNSDGICPGTSCSSGLLIRDGQHPVYGPVPGRRCGLCRYWITGPAHLLGQITAVNNLAFAIRKKGQELAKLNELKLDAEDAGNKRLARELRDRIDLLNRDIDLDVSEWAIRYRYAEESIQLMDEYMQARENLIATDATPHVPMMTRSPPMELKVTLEHAHEFALLDQITQMADFNPGFRNGEAELEKHQVLSKMLMANGLKPFLLELSADQSREAGNIMSALVLQQVNAQDLDEVLTGKKPLENYPYLASAMNALEEAAKSGQTFLPSALSKLSSLTAPLAFTSHGQDFYGSEETFG